MQQAGILNLEFDLPASPLNSHHKGCNLPDRADVDHSRILVTQSPLFTNGMD